MTKTYNNKYCTVKSRYSEKWLDHPNWTNWRSTVKKDLPRLGLTWEEAEVVAINRQQWHPA